MSTCILTQQDCGCCKTSWNNGCYEIVWPNSSTCCKIGDQFAINIEHHLHQFCIQVNFTHGGSFTTCCYRFCFLKRGVVHCIICLHELPKMQWLEYMGFVFMKELIISQMFLLNTFGKFMLTLSVVDMLQDSSLCPLSIVQSWIRL